MVQLKSKREIELMRESSRIVAEVLRLVGAEVKPGVTTLELDRLAEEYIRSFEAVPAFKGYGSSKHNLFPGTLCTSVDSEVVHGIPGRRMLKEGEILSVDVGVKKDGYYGDGAWSFPVGEISEEKERLLRVTEEALYRGIEKAIEGNRVHDISHAVQEYVEINGFSIVRDLVGHGVGKELHEEPSVPNFGDPGTGVRLKTGMTLAIEPMVNYGTWKVRVLADGWTIVTQDGMPSAHFEHTIAIVNGKPEILTQVPN
ncbi:MAG: type I methionyl aminopeptidase [Ignavibacteriales bacterium]|nr:type I methionyl aminopeptidase [Ignavibacteriales bacterium]